MYRYKNSKGSWSDVEEERRNLNMKQIGTRLLEALIIEDTGTVLSRVLRIWSQTNIEAGKQNINCSDNLQTFFGRLIQVCNGQERKKDNEGYEK